MEPQDLKILDTFDSLLDIISTVKNFFRNGLKQVYNYRLFKIPLTNYLPNFFDFQKLQNYHVGMKHLYEKLICFKLVSIHNYHFESKRVQALYTGLSYHEITCHNSFTLVQNATQIVKYNWKSFTSSLCTRSMHLQKKNRNIALKS